MMSKMIKINDRSIGEDKPCFVVAEVGVNHNGEIQTAKKMIEVAAESGVDAIKFQTFCTEEFMSNREITYSYETQGKLVEESMFDMFKRLELPWDCFAELARYSSELGLIFFSTPTDINAAQLLVELGVPMIKVGADDMVNLPLLRDFARLGKPMIISTGMSNIGEVEEAVETIFSTGNQQLVLMHCVSTYPAAEANLRAMKTLCQAFQVPVGFSDHTPGFTVACAAVALGAVVIEKHFTLDKNMYGPDHRFSLDPPELKALVENIRIVEKSLGSPRKSPVPAEYEMQKACRRSVCARVDIPADTVITKEMLTLQRPGTGLLPKYLDLIIGTKTRAPIRKGELLTWDRVLRMGE